MSTPPSVAEAVVANQLDVGQRIVVCAARVLWSVGVAGVIGMALLVAAAGLVVSGWLEQRAFEQQPLPAVVASAKPSSTVSAAVTAAPPLALPKVQQVPMLLERLERTAIAEGVGWSKADYRITDASADRPAVLEVRCALKAPYPALRRFVGAILRDTPALTFRDLSFSRATSVESNIEAKLTVAIYLDAPVREVPRTGTLAASVRGAR